MLHTQSAIQRIRSVKSLCKAYQGKIDQSRVTDVEEIGGNGIIAVVDGKKIAVGNSKLMRKIGVACQECHKVGTVVHVAIDGEYSGHILIADVLKPNAKRQLRRFIVPVSRIQLC